MKMYDNYHASSGMLQGGRILTEQAFTYCHFVEYYGQDNPYAARDDLEQWSQE